MTVNKRAVHSVVQLFISFRGFVHSVFRSFVFAGVRSVDRLIINSVIRLSVRPLRCSFARASACSFVCVSGLFGCSSVCPVLLFFFFFFFFFLYFINFFTSEVTAKIIDNIWTCLLTPALPFKESHTYT